MERKLVLTGIIKCKDEYLVVKRSKTDAFLPGAWEFPGGNIEDGELILNAFKREIFEEIGINIDTNNVKLINFYDKIKEKETIYHYIELDFLIELKNKDINIVLSQEHSDYTWVKADSDLLDEFIKNKIKNI